MKPSIDKNICGRRIRIARLAQKPPVSQTVLIQRLAKQGIALDRTSLSRIENQERGVADYELKAMARLLNTTMEWLCDERGTGRKP